MLPKHIDGMTETQRLFADARKHRPVELPDGDTVCRACQRSSNNGTWPCLVGRLVDWIDENVTAGAPQA